MKRIETTEIPRIQLNSWVVPSSCEGFRSVGHDLHILRVPSPHSADDRGYATVRIKLRETPFLPQSTAQLMPCDGICIEASGFHGIGRLIFLASLARESACLFPSMLTQAGIHWMVQVFSLAAMVDRSALMSSASLVLPPLMASRSDLQSEKMMMPVEGTDCVR